MMIADVYLQTGVDAVSVVSPKPHNQSNEAQSSASQVLEYRFRLYINYIELDAAATVDMKIPLVVGADLAYRARRTYSRVCRIVDAVSQSSRTTARSPSAIVT